MFHAYNNWMSEIYLILIMTRLSSESGTCSLLLDTLDESSEKVCSKEGYA